MNAALTGSDGAKTPATGSEWWNSGDTRRWPQGAFNSHFPIWFSKLQNNNKSIGYILWWLIYVMSFCHLGVLTSRQNDKSKRTIYLVTMTRRHSYAKRRQRKRARTIKLQAVDVFVWSHCRLFALFCHFVVFSFCLFGAVFCRFSRFYSVVLIWH